MSYREALGRGDGAWKGQNHPRSNDHIESNVGTRSRDDVPRSPEDVACDSDEAEDRDWEEEEEEEEDFESTDVLNSVVAEYSHLNDSKESVERIRQYLENSLRTDAGVCLICIENIKKIEPIWNCRICFGYFHLVCIQKWARENIFQQKQYQEYLPEYKRSSKINWACPKCRNEYDQTDIPSKYYCFCGKVEDPVNEPFSIPHSCGERCGKLLKPHCGHSCLLLCHPGPCPPCPQTNAVYCHCKRKGPIIKRCNDKLWSCGSTCGKELLCKKHSCKESCHPDECPPCDKESVQNCRCGLQKRKQPCMTPVWQCEKVCGKPFSCGFHSCSVRCHPGDCGCCPNSLERSCPCGKSSAIVSCTEEIPTCNETCGKFLECGVHKCEQKCHKGNCGMCLEIVKKECRCGTKKKDLPCSKEFLCDVKCKNLKNCLKHTCSRKCCNGICPPCDKICGRSLPCRNHKCPATCHAGKCYPCPEVVRVKCSCGSTVVAVPCGREKKTRPPTCFKPCAKLSHCHHPSAPHRCHFGECPPCREICGKVRKSCPHRCLGACHAAVWQTVNKNSTPSDPWEAAQAVTKRFKLPCPRCEVPVPVTCLGGHETRDQPCHEAEPKPCSMPCGRLLKCGNHYCEKRCHKVIGAGDSVHAGENCSECDGGCCRERPKGCTHECPSPCHPGECPPCDSNVKTKCHCGVSFMFIHCHSLLVADGEAKENLLSCGSPCPKNYPCGHRCELNCHSGKCPEPESCNKKVKIPCKCGRTRKDVACDVARSRGLRFVECTDACAAKAKTKKKEPPSAKAKCPKREVENGVRKRAKSEGSRRPAAAAAEEEEEEETSAEGARIRSVFFDVREWIVLGCALAAAAAAFVLLTIDTTT